MMNKHPSHKMPVIKCKVAGVFSNGETCPHIRCQANALCGAHSNKQCIHKITPERKPKKPNVGRDYKGEV